LALRLGVERFRLGMAPRLVGPGQFVGRCVDRHRHPSFNRGAAADLRGAAPDHFRTAVCLPADCRRGAATRRRSVCAGSSATADRPSARRGDASADRSPATARNHHCGTAAAYRLLAARIRALYRPSRPGAHCHRPHMAERRLFGRRFRSGWSGYSGCTFRPRRARICRKAARLSWPVNCALSLG